MTRAPGHFLKHTGLAHKQMCNHLVIHRAGVPGTSQEVKVSADGVPAEPGLDGATSGSLVDAGQGMAADSLTAVLTSLLLFLPSPPRAGDGEVVFEGKKGRLRLKGKGTL